MKRAFLIAFITILLLPSAAVKSSADDIANSAGAAILTVMQTGEVLYEKNADAPMLIASLTKVMTALIVIENAGADEIVTVDRSACGIEGSSLYLTPGERITVGNLLYALMLRSANDAATALAIHVSGSVEVFTELMNAKARELGLENTHFTNPHGLDGEEHYSCARDLAKLTSYALSSRDFCKLVSTLETTVPEPDGTDRYLKNHNRLLFTRDDCIGVKTGYTIRAGRCLISAAKRDRLTLIAVTLDDPDDWRDHESMLDYGFGVRRAVYYPSIRFTVPVVGGDSPVAVVTAGCLFSVMPADSPDPVYELRVPRFIYAPALAANTVGCAILRIGSDVVASSDAFVISKVDKARPEYGFFEILLKLIGY